MTLETQYNIFLKKHPELNYTYTQWMEKVLKPNLENAIKEIEKSIKEDL